MPQTVEKTKKLTPTLRFPGFFGDWEDVKFGGVFSFLSTNSFSREKLNYKDGEVKNIHYGDIHTKFKSHFDIAEEKVPYINDDVDLSKKDNYCTEGDLVIADASEDYNDIGKSIEILKLKNEKVVTGLHTIHARPKKDVMALGFSGFLMQTWNVRKQMMVLAQGIKVLGLSTKYLKDVNLQIPPLPEQQKIATFLSTVDKWLENLHEQKAKLEEYKKGMMQKIFSQEIRFKDEDGKAFPDWEEKRLGEVALVEMGQSPDSIAYNEEGKGKYLIQGNADIFGRITSPRIWSSQITKECKVGDVIMTVRAPVGYISRSLHNAVIGRGVCAIRNNSNSDLGFLYQFLLRYEPRWIKYSQGSTFTAVNSKDVKELNLLLPPLPEQKKIADFLGAVDQLIELTTQKINQVEKWKKGLMQGLFV